MISKCSVKTLPLNTITEICWSFNSSEDIAIDILVELKNHKAKKLFFQNFYLSAQYIYENITFTSSPGSSRYW